jgi:hypothetical protein
MSYVGGVPQFIWMKIQILKVWKQVINTVDGPGALSALMRS